jgi:membrane protein YqaA with SNARE-associated domain
VALLALSLAFGAASAFVPILNAEAFIGANAVLSDGRSVALVCLGVTVGQVLGKWVIFSLSRAGFREIDRHSSGSGRMTRFIPERVRSASNRLLNWVDAGQRTAMVVFVSASVGIPPLALVAVLAGRTTISQVAFVTSCAIGRTLRFVVIGLTLANVT